MNQTQLLITVHYGKFSLRREDKSFMSRSDRNEQLQPENPLWNSAEDGDAALIAETHHRQEVRKKNNTKVL